MRPMLRHALAVAAVLLTLSAATSRAQPGSVAAGPPLAPVRPMPAEVMPRASQSLLLAVANTGSHLVAAGERGHILVSNDGAHWAQVPVPVRSALTALSFLDAQTGWAVGHDATILKTTDGGRSWLLQNFEPQKGTAFLDVLFVDARRGYAVGAFGIFYTTRDGGDNWAEADAPAVRKEELYLHAITRLGNGSLLIAGETGMLGVSADGAKWKRLKSPYPGTLFGALPYGAKGALIFGLRGNVFVSDDAQNGRWKKIATNTVESFYGGKLLPDGRAMLVGSAGRMLIVDAKAGKSEPVASGLSSSLSAIADFRGRLLVCGEAGLKLVAR